MKFILSVLFGFFIIALLFIINERKLRKRKNGSGNQDIYEIYDREIRQYLETRNISFNEDPEKFLKQVLIAVKELGYYHPYTKKADDLCVEIEEEVRRKIMIKRNEEVKEQCEEILDCTIVVLKTAYFEWLAGAHDH